MGMQFSLYGLSHTNSVLEIIEMAYIRVHEPKDISVSNHPEQQSSF
jgi:hypothetical protein